MDYSEAELIVEWLQASKENIENEEFRVGNLLPATFTNYTALLPAVGIIDGFPFDQIHLHNPSIAQLNHNAYIWRQYGIYTVHATPTYQPTRFEHLASRFSLPYDASIITSLDWRKQGFAIDWERTTSNLRALLHQVTPGDALLVLYVLDYYRWEAINVLPSARNGVYHVSVDEYMEFLMQSYFDPTAYLFPKDKSWCLLTVEDGSFPILAANFEPESAVETLPLNPTSYV
jgi:hypothetical protein